MTQLALANAIGMTPGMIHRWEAGSSVPGGAAAVRLANALGVSETWLLTGARDKGGGANPATLAAIRAFLASELGAGLEAWKADALRGTNIDALRPTIKTIYALACATDWLAVGGDPSEDRTTTRPTLVRRR
jgi:transcriptional regulator with XRE-family HTH domain